MKVCVYRIALTLSVLAFLGGCGTYNGGSLFGRGNVNRNDASTQTDEAPPPKAAPTEPVEAQTLQAPASPAPSETPKPQMQASAAASPANSTTIPAGLGKTKVAILLPLSGKNAALGQAMLNAAQMAVFDMSVGSFELMPRDTDGSEASATAAARDAVASGAQLLIGPLFGTQVPSVKAIAEPAGLNVLTLSTDTSLAAPGTFVMGFAPGAQVDRVVNYAVAEGLKRIAALVPSNAYGVLVSQAFRQSAARFGGTIVDLETYDPTKRSSAAAIAALAIYRDRIDALFVPAGGDELRQIAEQLAAAGFDNHRVKLLGTGLWDEADISQRSNFLVGGWYAAPDPAARKNFIAAYARAYGQEPPRLTTLAYDATALAAVLARRGERFDRAALTNPNGFAGVDGIFRLTDQGLVERGLAIDEVQPTGEHVVSSAPVTFVGMH